MAVRCVCGAASARPVVMTKDGFDITKCDSCGVGRTQIVNFDPEEFYTEDYFTGRVDGAYLDYVGSQTTLRSEFRDQLAFLKSHTPKGGKLLEVGCAYGFFLQEAKSHFDVYGFEVAHAAVAHCHRTGLPNVQQGIVTEDFLKQHGPFDAIVLLDVIEHIDDVEEAMAMLTRYLNPAGVILVTTGDWNSLPARITGAKWRLMTPPLHLWFFTPKGLTEMFQQMGLKMEHTSHPWKLVPLELILSQAFSMLSLKWQPRLPSAIKNAGLPANMFDAMRMLFRKPA